MTFSKYTLLFRLSLLLLLNGIGLLSFAQTPVGASAQQSGRANLVLFGRSTYPGDDSTYDLIHHSGFTTLMLSSFYIKSNGDVLSGDDGHNPIIHDGKFTGSKEWVRRVQSLRKQPGSINRIEVLLEGRWYGQPPNTYDFIRDWIDSAGSAPGSTSVVSASGPVSRLKGYPGIVPGTGKGSTLYTIVRILKETVGADAICIDDESVYDSTSIVRLGEMCGKLGVHMSLCPFAKLSWWKYVIDHSHGDVIDAVYLQCYDGGKNNTPGPWALGLNGVVTPGSASAGSATSGTATPASAGTSDHVAPAPASGDRPAIPVYPIFLCRGAFDTCGTNHNSKTPDQIGADMLAYKKEYPGIKGAGIWQIADIKNYIRLRCAVTDPSSGTATTVPEFLDQLKEALKRGL